MDTSALTTDKLQQIITQLRHGQRELAQWQGGPMAISAVPGAGKSHSLAVAAALTVVRHRLNNQRKLVIVTYTKSAAASIKGKIRDRLRELEALQGGFDVFTLHGLALDLASRYPGISGIDLENQTIVSPHRGHRLVRDGVEQWIKLAPDAYRQLTEGINFDGEETERLRRQSVLRTEVLPDLMVDTIREAKSSGLTPADLEQWAHYTTDDYGILTLAAGLYRQYQQLLQSRNCLDYDDMILGALKVLERPQLREQWQEKIFGVFEDEAQDSSPLQEQLISILAGGQGQEPNLVRVGDPNQAINSTFTPADPVYFQRFCHQCGSSGQWATMDQAGRSSSIIIEAANFALAWIYRVMVPKFGEDYLPLVNQAIAPVPPQDPQPDANPPATGGGLEIYTPEDVFATVNLIQQRVIQLFQAHPDRTAAILIRENKQGNFLAQHLAPILEQEHHIKVYEVQEQERHSQIPGEVLTLLRFCDRPHSPDYLKSALTVLAQRRIIVLQDFSEVAVKPEAFLYPIPSSLEAALPPTLDKASHVCRSLLKARLELPYFRLIPFLGLTLQYTGAELATLHKLAMRVNQARSLQQIIRTIAEIVGTERFEPVEEGQEHQYTQPGQVTIMTLHKAKGLDWDYVFLPFLHERSIPGSAYVPKGRDFLGDFTLSAVARAQIRTGLHHRHQGQPLDLPTPQEAWIAAERLKQAEEYRLLYVGMTRAKRLLWMAAAQQGPFQWGRISVKGQQDLTPLQPCPLVMALKHHFSRSPESS